MKLNELYNKSARPQFLDEVILGDEHRVLNGVRTINEERKWINGRFERNIGIDQSSHLHGNGKTHAHVFGRRGNELGVVNFDGTSSHGSKFKLHQKDADALRNIGCNVRSDNIVEWVKIGEMPNIIYG